MLPIHSGGVSMSIVKSWCPLLVLAVAGAACHTRPPATAPSRTTSPIASAGSGPPAGATATAPPAAAARPAGGATHRSRAVSAQVAGRAQCGASTRRCVLRLRPEHVAGRCQAGAAAGRAVAREVAADDGSASTVIVTSAGPPNTISRSATDGPQRFRTISPALESGRIGFRRAVLGKRHPSAMTLENRAGHRTGAVISRSRRSERKSLLSGRGEQSVSGCAPVPFVTRVPA